MTLVVQILMKKHKLEPPVSMPPPETHTPIVICPDLSNLVETQGKDFKIAITNMFKDFK